MLNGKLVECESLMDFQDRVEQILNKETEKIEEDPKPNGSHGEFQTSGW